MPTEKNSLEVLSDQLSAWLVARVQAMPTAKVPFGARKLSGAEQWANYNAMKDDPQAWGDIVAKRGPEGAVEFFNAMTKLGERHGERQEISDGTETAEGE